jgi:hypothetical protein
MRISRRQFACGIAGAAALGSVAARPPGVVERRSYAHGSVLPPLEVLQRHGIYPESVKRQQSGTAYSIAFDTLETRIKAWDRFNADEDWCALRDAGRVALQEIRVCAGS